jgi:bacterioferritin-associated ferredoxin
MYICLCHAVTDKAIYEAVDRGVSTYSELAFNTGCGTQCGSCAKTARALFDEARETRCEPGLTIFRNSAVAA